MQELLAGTGVAKHPAIPTNESFLELHKVNLHGIVQELLSGTGVAKQVADTKAAREVAALRAFFEMLATDSTRAFYGPGHVIAAAEQGAVGTLLLADGLYKCALSCQRCCCCFSALAV